MAEIDPTIKHAMDQEFAAAHAMFQQSAARFNTSTELTSNEAARMFQLETQLVGALAASRLDKSAAADKILEMNSTRDQPGANKTP